MSGHEHLHAFTLPFAIGSVGEHGGAPGGEQAAGVVGDGVVDARGTEGTVCVRLVDDQPPSHPFGIGMVDHRRHRDRTMQGDGVRDRGQLREGGTRHRLGEDVDDSAARQADGEGVVVGDAVALQLGPSGLDHLTGQLVDRGLDAATRNRACDRAVGGDHHGGACRPRRRLHGAHDGGHTGGTTGPPYRDQIVEHIAHIWSLCSQPLVGTGV